MARVQFSYSRVTLRKSGPKIKIQIGHPQEELEIARQQGVRLKEPRTVTALIDTGASISVLNPQLAATCGLRQTGKIQISTAGQVSDRPEYACAVAFPSTHLAEADPLRIVARPLPGQDVACLLGRDLLERWRFTYDGRTGEVDIEE
jgi:predicted aspartyl protease